jgi:hypothetical protein
VGDALMLVEAAMICAAVALVCYVFAGVILLRNRWVHGRWFA